MATSPSVKIYDSLGQDYQTAFAVFLAHTDQKTQAWAWLEREVAGLANREVFIDAGAGNGKLTQWLQSRFQKTIAVEPNPTLRKELQVVCPQARIIPATIDAAEPEALADFVLCSHVFYYLERKTWQVNLEKLASWLRPKGVLVVALQNHETDCMKMLRHFTGKEFDLSALGRCFADAHPDQFDTRLETVQAHIQTPTLETAYIIAEFMLNLVDLPRPPARAEVETYVQDHFSCPGGGFRFSCHQDFLRIRRKEILPQ